MTLIRETVELSEGRSYPVLVGFGARHELGAVISPQAKRAAIVTQGHIGVSVDPGIEHRVFEIGDGEEAKNLATIGDLTSRFAEWGMTRRDGLSPRDLRGACPDHSAGSD